MVSYRFRRKEGFVKVSLMSVISDWVKCLRNSSLWLSVWLTVLLFVLLLCQGYPLSVKHWECLKKVVKITLAENIKPVHSPAEVFRPLKMCSGHRVHYYCLLSSMLLGNDRCVLFVLGLEVVTKLQCFVHILLKPQTSTVKYVGRPTVMSSHYRAT